MAGIGIQSDEVAAAIAAANLAFDDPNAPLPYEPTTYEAARAAVVQLSRRFTELPGTARLLAERARQGGEMLSSDRLQGLSEIAQNAEDVGASRLSFRLDGVHLTAAHDGRAVTLRDVWALSMPWMTTKSSETDALGRFGIGLTTLAAISPTLEVLCWPYAFRIEGTVLSSLEFGDVALVGDSSRTTLRLALRPGTIGADDIGVWMERWSDSALLFCRNLSEVSFHTPAAASKVLRLTWSGDEKSRLKLGGHPVEASRAVATTSDERRWVRWTADVPAPNGLERRYKKTGATMPVGVALPLHEHRFGRIHAGLPLLDVQVPVAVNAHFDPTAGRQHLIENQWNTLQTELVADLWVEAMTDLFKRQPRLAWRLIPVPETPELAPTSGLESAILHRARTTLHERIAFNIHGDELPLTSTAHEVGLLEGILTEDQIARLAGTTAALPVEVRDKAGRWRHVLDDWRTAGAPLAPPVTVSDALPLLDEDIPVAQAVALAAAAIADGHETRLLSRRWLSDADGERFAPPTPEDIWAFTTSRDLWALDLGLARPIHPDTLTQGEASELVVSLLRRNDSLIDTGKPGAYLGRLAVVGEAGHRMTTVLSDTQLVAIRDALEGLTTSQQQRLGPGIGQAIVIEAFEYGPGGKRIQTTASPSETYLPKTIDREPDSFAVAAGTTPGIPWVASRYANVLRSPHGRAGLGAQKLFRTLGAETAPRLIQHPDLHRRYETDQRRGLPKYIAQGPPARSEFLTALEAQYTLEDHDSPDLEAVLRHIASDRKAKSRRSRAAAVVSSLGRAWDRLGDKAEVTAADDYYGWNAMGTGPAFWIWRARSIKWLDNTAAHPTAPSQLWLRTPANVAVHGSDSDDYLHRDIPTARPELLTLLGITGEPTMTEMVDRLVELRDLEAVGGEVSPTDTAMLYQGIAAQVGRRRTTPGHLTAVRLRARFSSGPGLIRTQHGWRPPTRVLAGEPVFGHFRAFVPPGEGAEPLWRTLEIPAPSWRDCVEVLRLIAAADQDDDVAMESIELGTLRLLASILEEEELPRRSRATLAKTTLRTTQGRVSRRPIFVLPDQVVTAAIASKLPLWTPGGELEQFAELIEPFDVTQLGDEHLLIQGTEKAVLDEEATELFRAAVAQLSEDLVRNDPQAAVSLDIGWPSLEALSVYCVERLTVQVTPPSGMGQAVIGHIDAYAAPAQGRIYLTDPDHLDAYGAGARAVAALFATGHRRIAQAWLAACESARDGRETKRLELAALQAQEANQQQTDAFDKLLALQLETAAKPQPTRRKRASMTGDATDGYTETSDAAAPRRLVDPAQLVIVNPEGMIVGGEAVARGRRIREHTDSGLPIPGPGRPLGSHVAPRGYTEIDKESVGLDLVRAVLRSDDHNLVDLRAQRGVGADAIDDLRRYYELKVYEGEEPDQVRLEPSQIDRAKSTDGFFLVVVSNVEDGNGQPKVRIITDPLTQLERIETRAVSFAGVKTATSLVFEMARQATRNAQEKIGRHD